MANSTIIKWPFSIAVLNYQRVPLGKLKIDVEIARFC